MIDGLLDNDKWQRAAWLIMGLAFVVGLLICSHSALKGGSNLLVWFYFFAMAGLMIFTSAATFLFTGTLAAFINFCSLMIGTFLFPLAYYAFTENLNVAVIGGMAYMILLVAVVPRLVGVCVLSAGVAFACCLKYYRISPGETGSLDFYLIALVFVMVGLVAFCWRMLIQKMYDLFMNAAQTGSQLSSREINELRQNLEKTKNEERLLKEEIALQIVEMKNIIGEK